MCAPTDSRHRRLRFPWLASRQLPALRCDRGKRRSQALGPHGSLHGLRWVYTPASSLRVLRSQRLEPRRPQLAGLPRDYPALRLSHKERACELRAFPRHQASPTASLGARRSPLCVGCNDHVHSYTPGIMPPGPAQPEVRISVLSADGGDIPASPLAYLRHQASPTVSLAARRSPLCVDCNDQVHSYTSGIVRPGPAQPEVRISALSADGGDHATI